MAYSPKQQKAIQHYLDKHPELKLSMGTPGRIQFVNRETGEFLETIGVNYLVSQYEAQLKEDRAERARLARKEKSQPKPFKEQYL